MKDLIDKIRSSLASLGNKFKRKQGDAAVGDPSAKPRTRLKADRFTIISWVTTIFVVVVLIGSTILYKNSRPTTYTSVAQPTNPASEPTASAQPLPGAPGVSADGSGISSIPRKLQLITNIPERPRYDSVIYRVSRGDAMLSIAEDYKLKSETLLYVNDQLEDNPHNLKPGMELTIPPVDGLYYEWKEGDTFETVAEKFDASPDDIITFPGNHVDLTDPKIDPGTLTMIPGGSRELRNWAADLQTMGRGANTGTGGANAGNACGGGLVGSGFGWPADDHTLSGNPYGPSHLGIDISAPEGSNVYAASSGVVTQAAPGWNYGYGNVIQIDHGNGYVTVYAHLSQINVSPCASVGQGALIGLSGNTGNSFGSHLHFEIRSGGTNINPYDIVQ